MSAPNRWELDLSEDAESRVGLDAAGLVIGGETVPLLSGSMHYFRMARAAWRPALEALKSLGARFVDTYVPWSVHERGPGDYDFGAHDPRLDVVAFLEVVGELGLYAIVRPGPHINAELTQFGIPERVLWDPPCQALSPGGAPVILPIPPLAFPVPSYASRAFHGEASRWLRAAAEQLAPLVYPHGPIVLCQVDNEGAMYFRDGVYDQDYHPDAITQYRRFLTERYKGNAALRAAHGDPSVTFASVLPPKSLGEPSEAGLAPHLDWAEFQEALVESALYRFRAVLDRHGLGSVPKMHNLPVAERATPLDPMRLEHVVDFVSIDYYHHASEPIRAEIERRTTSVAERCAVRNVPAFAAEMGAGFAPYFPPLAESDNQFTVLAALAYGLRGFNLYMAVERDRWIGGPIDVRGRPRPSADFWSALFTAFERTRFHTLRRTAPVHLVIPRSFDRLARVCHAFDSIPQAAFAFAGQSVERAGLEGVLDPTCGATIETEAFVHTLQHVLHGEGVQFSVVGGDLLEASLAKAAWTIVACPGALPAETTSRLISAMAVGARVSVGPRAPERDATYRATNARLPNLEHPTVPQVLPRGPATLAELVKTTITELAVPRLIASPETIHTTLHHDAEGRPRVLFLLNGGGTPVPARVHVSGVTRAMDALTGENATVVGGHIEVTVPPHTVRMLELVTAP
ncbi:MAG TPA: beta-galactosidase [Polyangiaceae bacterium]